ncbi:hypothetical protein N0V90_007983 [Kalmusia sp. IMI 367209]|nr:hypothetical protein N0V90_007983 [Kalmusia sp. IMI 367209]
MARLNEPPVAPAPVPAPSTEALEAAKRKFMRQNRELAKINSQQSIRIRTLENDCSRLVADNLSLREQVLHLQNTLEAQAHAPSFSTIDTVKNQLEAKIQELGGLVAELGQLNKRRGTSPCKSQATATRRSPDERQWRSALGLQEVEDAMLPTIMENKSYPRMTMNAEELQGILDSQGSQSPDIGPPPVSRFEIEEPLAFDPKVSIEDQPDQPAEDEESTLPINLDTRRRRRESGPKTNSRRMSLFESPPDELEEVPVKVIKTGAKRKFSVQEDEVKGQILTEPFQFNRRNTPVSADEGNMDEDRRAQSPRRPILSSKPVNTDPIVSPKKQRSSAPEKSEKPEKKSAPKSTRPRLTITRNIRPEIPPPEMPEPIPITEIHLDSLPPKTPAAEAILSPPSTEPSTSRPESKDTPPPGDLGSMSQTGIVGRPSRRARPQVSYKEPSLNTKMRRPGKELVDAVTSDQSRRTSVEPQSAAPSSATVAVKDESRDSPWKPIGAVSGQRGEDDGELGSPLRQKLDRKEGSQDVKPDPPKLNSAAASHAISAMIEETRRKSLTSTAIQSLKETTDEPKLQTRDPKARVQTQDPESDMAIFDFNESSPPTVAPSLTTCRPKVDLAKAVRAGRRHSSIPATAVGEDRRTEIASKLDGALPAVHKRTGSGSVKTGATMGLGRSTAVARASIKERERKTSTLPLSGSTPELKAKIESEGTGVGNTRSERAASRRKSMMV